VFYSFVRYLAGRGYDMSAEIQDRDVKAPYEASDGMQQVLKKAYDDDDTDATAVCELLVDLDEGMQEVALSPRQDGGADARRPVGHRRLGRRHLPADHGRQADLPRPVGRPGHGLTPGRGYGTVHGRPGRSGPGRSDPASTEASSIRFLPWCLATYSAASASRSSVLAWSRKPATPTETVTGTSVPGRVTSAISSANRSVSLSSVKLLRSLYALFWFANRPF